MMALSGLGHELVFVSERDEPTDREPIQLQSGMAELCVAELGEAGVLDALRKWRPDVIFANSLLSPMFVSQFLDIAPLVVYVHAYGGTCISGSKAHAAPRPTPCDRRFGLGCIACYYPRRCGGLSPVTMLRDYARQRERLRLLAGVRRVVTNSLHMQSEYRKHGIDAICVYPFATDLVREPPPRARLDLGVARRLLFLGRLESLKGGDLLIDSLPHVRRALNVPIELTFAGAGSREAAWAGRAAVLASADSGLSVSFAGWIDAEKREELFLNHDLLVIPSVWPEPFGLVGVEAGLRSLPAVAFAVGGIPEWLFDRVNGKLASNGEVSSKALAEAIAECLSDAQKYESLCTAARQKARKYNVGDHLSSLTGILESAAHRVSV